MLEGAVFDLEQSRKLNPWDPYPALALANACDALGLFEEAEKNLADACRAAPLFQEPRLALAIHLNRLQRWAEAEEAYLRAGEARAGRTSDEWFDLYQQMLRDASR